MTAADRRRSILSALQTAHGPLSATTLAGKLSVSRQVIVGDVALLRASGADITATPRGYVLGSPSGLRRSVACRHEPEQMERELQLMLAHGCTVEDVVVEHAVYGQLIARLDISCRYDLVEFTRRISESDALPLASLTGGIHLHTLRCPNEDAFSALLDSLRREGFLVE